MATNPQSKITVAAGLVEAYAQARSEQAEATVVPARYSSSVKRWTASGSRTNRVKDTKGVGIAVSRAPVRALFFDVGGTLLHPWPSVGAIYASVARRHGMTVTVEGMERAFRESWAALKGPD